MNLGVEIIIVILNNFAFFNAVSEMWINTIISSLPVVQIMNRF